MCKSLWIKASGKCIECGKHNHNNSAQSHNQWTSQLAVSPAGTSEGQSLREVSQSVYKHRGSQRVPSRLPSMFTGHGAPPGVNMHVTLQDVLDGACCEKVFPSH